MLTSKTEGFNLNTSLRLILPLIGCVTSFSSVGFTEHYQKFQFVESYCKLTGIGAQLAHVKIGAEWWILWPKPHENTKGNIFISSILRRRKKIKL